MPVLELETAARKPPPSQADTLGRDVNRWAWDGLSIAFPLLEAGPAGWREVITGAQPTSIVGTVTGGRDNRGQIMVSQVGGAPNYLEYVHAPQHLRPTSEITVVCRFRWNGTTTVGAGVFAKVHTVNDQTSWSVATPDTAGRLGGTVSTSGSPTGQNTDAISTSILSTTDFTNVFLRWRDGEILTVTILKDGGASAGNTAASSAAVTGPISYTTGPMRIFGGDSASLQNSPGGDLSTLLVYARKLTDAECRALAVDPFLPFRRPIRGAGRLAGEPPAWQAGQVMVG